jgi:capsular exopolysaccharide synthesis family protein
MEPVDYLNAFRRRWAVLAAAVAVALTAAWVVTSLLPRSQSVPDYQATTVLLQTKGSNPISGGGSAIDNLGTTAALTTVGEVPKQAAKTLRFRGDPRQLARQVKGSADNDTRLLTITAVDRNPRRATRIADVFAAELLEYLRHLRVEQEEKTLTARIQKLQSDIDRLRGQDVTGELERLEKQLATSRAALERLSSRAEVPGGLRVVQKASSEPVKAVGLQPPRNRLVQLLIAAFLGLVAGIGIVLVLERVDTRVRTKDAVEERFKLPVLAEIPLLPRRERDVSVLAAPAEAAYPAMDAFRILAAAVVRQLALHRTVTGGNGNGHAVVQPPAVLVTSAGPGEGKTTVVANLAARLAEQGKQVLVLSCDFHRPTVHRLLEVPDGAGLAEALQSPDIDLSFTGHICVTALDGVWLVRSGSASSGAGALLSSEGMRTVLIAARRYADVVLLDSPPILATSDAAYLMPAVDGVLVVVRAGKTTAEVVARTSEVLERLGAPGLGVVLNGSTSVPSPRGYWRYHAPTGEELRRGFPGLPRHPEQE